MGGTPDLEISRDPMRAYVPNTECEVQHTGPRFFWDSRAGFLRVLAQPRDRQSQGISGGMAYKQGAQGCLFPAFMLIEYSVHTPVGFS
jgi:hypothetical protein